MYPSDGDRRRIVTSMCYTTRHDYGLERLGPRESNGVVDPVGMNRQQQEALYKQMDQLYDHHIHPLMRMLTEILGNTKDEDLKRRIRLSIKESSGG